MLAFLRRIRRKLIDEGNLNRYLVYAIGEILLVVIGILIALQINNWNESKKSLRFENQLKMDIYKAIDINFSDFNRSVDYTERAIQSIEILRDYLAEEKAYDDSLNTHFHYSTVWAYQRLNHTAYETAKQYGLHFIQNDTLRSNLFDLYEVHQNLILQFEDRQHDFHYQYVTPFLADHFERRGERGEKLIPVDYAALKSNPNYDYILQTNYRERLNELRWFKMQIRKMEIAKEQLLKEIK